MFALVLILALTVATGLVAHRLDRLVDVGIVVATSILCGLVFIVAHPAISLVGEPPDDADGTCGIDEIPLVAPVVERISVTEAQVMLAQAQVTFVDARASYHYTSGHIPGAMNLPADDAEGLLDMQSLPIPPEGQVITYCEGGTCEQSQYLGLVLRERDVCQRVWVLDGGWQAWVSANAPTAVGSSPWGDDADPSNASVEAGQ